MGGFKSYKSVTTPFLNHPSYPSSKNIHIVKDLPQSGAKHP